MAEGHAVHGLAGRLLQLQGQRVRSLGSEEFAGATTMDLATLADAQAYGKHLLVSFAAVADSVHVHLGMTGKFSVRAHHRALVDGFPRTQPPVPPQLRWRLLTSGFHADLTAPPTCELLDPAGVAALIARLGPDPLRPDADPSAAVRKILRSTRPIGQLLLDQGVIAGVGNVYRAELLHRAGLDPHTPGRDLDEATVLRLWDDTVVLMTLGMGAGWIVTDTEQMRAAREHLIRGERVPRWPKRYAVYSRSG